MPTIKVTVHVDGRPLRRAYVEHATSLGFVSSEFYLTDNEGRVRDKDGNLGIETMFGSADLRIHCQNTVIRVHDGARVMIPVTQDKSGIRDGDVINLNTDAEQHAHYAILNRCLLTYDNIIRRFRPFSGLRNPDFPLGRKSALRATREQPQRLNLSYPSHFPLASAAFVEPFSLPDGYPLIQIKDRTVDGRLFGENGAVPTLIPAELSHACHFALLPASVRGKVSGDYLGWIALDTANGGDGRHRIGKRTSPMVAYVEAFDHFVHRLAEFIRVTLQRSTSSLMQSQTLTAAQYRQFLDAEVAGTTTGRRVAQLDAAGNIRPSGAVNPDDEGTIYGCIFIDFARRTSLTEAVNAYLLSAKDGAITIGQYRNYLATKKPRLLPAFDAARATWGL